MKLERFNAKTASLKDITDTIDAVGYVILDKALSAYHVRELHKELEPYFAGRKVCQSLFFGYNTTRIEALFTKSRATQFMAVDPLILDIVNHILGANCDSFQINLTQGIRIHPGERAQILHPDSALFPIKNKPFEFQVNTIWAYDHFTQKNGATLVVPGSHKWPEDRKPEPHEIGYAEMQPGSVLLYGASLLHGGGANNTNDMRTGIVISYCLGWLRQSENQYLSYPPNVAKHFSPKLQELIGYNVHRPNLGWVNGQDPSYLLKDDVTPPVRAEEFLTDEQNKLLKEYYEGQNVSLTSHNL